MAAFSLGAVDDVVLAQERAGLDSGERQRCHKDCEERTRRHLGNCSVLAIYKRGEKISNSLRKPCRNEVQVRVEPAYCANSLLLARITQTGMQLDFSPSESVCDNEAASHGRTADSKRGDDDEQGPKSYEQQQR